MVELKNFKGTRIAQCFHNVNETPEETVRLRIQSNFEKGLIDKDTFLNASKQLDDLIEKAGKKTGEGSRGGRVIGHTQSGKPIYADASHDGHKNFTSQDHTDAAELHHAHAERAQGEGSLANKDSKVKNHIKQSEKHYSASAGGQKDHGSAREHAKKQVYDHQYHYDMMKHHQSEGDKAHAAGDHGKSAMHYDEAHNHFNHYAEKKAAAEGKEIGKTRSGKSIYDSYHHPAHKDFDHQDHADANYVHDLNRQYSKGAVSERHRTEARKHTVAMLHKKFDQPSGAPSLDREISRVEREHHQKK